MKTYKGTVVSHLSLDEMQEAGWDLGADLRDDLLGNSVELSSSAEATVSDARYELWDVLGWLSVAIGGDGEVAIGDDLMGDIGAALNEALRLPSPISFTTQAPTAPSRPNILNTDFGDGEIYLYVSSSSNGGSAITGYEATCSDGTNTFTGTSTSSPITILGLTNDVAYSCTVTAINSVGESSASAATDPITPEETSTGLPIWLLYQATQQ
jgi:hypothetical protein